MAFVIQDPKAPKMFLSVFGWVHQNTAMRWRTKEDADHYNAKRGNPGVVVSATFDDRHVPGVATDYDPFGLGTANFSKGD
jgi:hypothetical protein